MSGSNETSIYLFYCIGRMLMIGPQPENTLHQHAGIQIIMALDDSFSVRMENGNWQKTKAVIIDSHVPHQVKDLTGRQVTISTVPERSRGKKLKSMVLRGSKMLILDSWKLSFYVEKFKQCFSGSYDCQQAFGMCEDVIDHLTGSNRNREIIDRRIQLVLYWIQENLTQPVSASRLAQKIFLSEDRFLHLFKEQVGLPLRRYVLFQRMMKASVIFLSGLNLSTAAHEAGFSDLSHFTRTFIEMNGVKPSQFAKNKEKYHFRFCSSVCAFCNASTHAATNVDHS